MMKNWRTVRLPEIADYFIGLTYSPKEVSDKGTIVLRSSNIQDDELDLSDLVRVTAPVKDALKVRRGDILMCSRNGSKRLVGKTALIGELSEEMTFGTFMTVIRSQHNPYLAWFFKSDLFRCQISSGGHTAINQVTKYMLDAIRIPLPPSEEQERIVHILDEVFEGIATAKANAEKNLASALALLSEGFGRLTEKHDHKNWIGAKVRQIAASKKGAIRTGPFGSQLLHGEFVNEGIAVLGIDNAVANEFRWDKRRFITPEKYDQLKRYRVYPGDVLITIMGTCGRCAIVPEDIPIAINTKHLCCITLDRAKCIPEYLHAYFLYHPVAQDFLLRHAKGAIMAGLNMGLIEELPVLLPTIDQQQKLMKSFALLKDDLRQLEEMYRQKIAALDALKQSLLREAFSGRL